jgi:hypothetical protein
MKNIRNIVDYALVPHSAFEVATTRLNQAFRCADGVAESVCTLIYGESRTGKTRTLEEFCARRPPQRTPDGLEVPIVRIKTPSKPTVKGLAEVLLQALQDPKAFSKGTEIAKTTQLTVLMRETRVQMLMIDEFQHFYDKGSHKIAHHAADWLKILVDDTKAALVVAGLPSCKAIIEQNEQLAGRFMAEVRMPRYDWKYEADREEFCAILAAFHETLAPHFDLPAMDAGEIAFRFYCATGGLMGYLTKILKKAVYNALDMNRKTIGLADLDIAQKESILGCTTSRDAIAPFGRGFITAPNDDLLARVRALGSAKLEPHAPRRRRGSAGTNMSVSHVLSAKRGAA